MEWMPCFFSSLDFLLFLLLVSFVCSGSHEGLGFRWPRKIVKRLESGVPCRSLACFFFLRFFFRRFFLFFFFPPRLNGFVSIVYESIMIRRCIFTSLAEMPGPRFFFPLIFFCAWRTCSLFQIIGYEPGDTRKHCNVRYDILSSQ